MKQAGYTKRPYGRSPERPRQTHTNTKHSNGASPESKMRGNPQQCVEKYLTLARDATSLGDPISAENYYQFADHYFRLVAATRVSRIPPRTERIVEDSDRQGIDTQIPPDPVPPQSENWLE